MLITNQQLTEWYLDDLTLPDTLHGRTKPKVSKPGIWHNLAITQFNTLTKDLNELVRSSLDNMWIWSDLHFGHSNIISYTQRPFADKDDMTAQLIKNYNSVITNDDVVIFNGDVAFMKENQINAILRNLPGYKILIIGNHDIDRKKTGLMKLAFDEIHLCQQITIKADITWQLLLTHYPLTNIPTNCINVHGHIHDNVSQNPRHINVCVEHTNYSPKPLREVVERGYNIIKEG